MYNKRVSEIKKAIPSMVLGEELRFDCPNDYEKYWEVNAFSMRMFPGPSDAHFHSLIYSWQPLGLPVSAVSASELSAEKTSDGDAQEVLLILPIQFQGHYETEFGPITLEDQRRGVLMSCDSLLRGKESGTALNLSLNAAKLKDTLTWMAAGDAERAHLLLERPVAFNTQSHDVHYLSVIKNLCDTAALLKNKPGAIQQLGLDDTVYRLAAHMLLDDSDPADKPRRQDQFSLQVLNGVLDWVLSNLGESITLTKLERISGLSARSLQLMFSRHLNTTPMSWVKEQRIQKAHQLLMQQPSLLVSEVAHLCGYPSAEMFAARYRQRFGQTPSQSRR
jgi:AraC-like DNA-binding protein